MNRNILRFLAVIVAASVLLNYGPLLAARAEDDSTDKVTPTREITKIPVKADTISPVRETPNGDAKTETEGVEGKKLKSAAEREKAIAAKLKKIDIKNIRRAEPSEVKPAAEAVKKARKDEQVAKIKEALMKKIDAGLTRLGDLLEEIQADTRIDQTIQTALVETLADRIGVLQDLRVQAEAVTTLDEARALKERVNAEHIFDVIGPTMRLWHITAHLLRTQTRLEEVITALNRKLATLKDQGGSSAEAESQLATAQTELLGAQNALEQAKNTLGAVTNLTLNRETLNQVKELLKQAKTHIQLAREALAKAHGLLESEKESPTPRAGTPTSSGTRDN